MEKSQNKRQRSFVFDDLSELKHYQSGYGGRINIISKILEEYTSEELYNGLDSGLDNGLDSGLDITDTRTRVNINYTKQDSDYYALNISNSAVFENGFRYIKELLLHHHNYMMYESYKTLSESHIRVFSVRN